MASKERTDAHRPSAIDPAAYEYRWAFDTADERGPTAARFEELLRASETSVYRDPRRCDHCGAHLRYAVIYEHLPSGGVISTGVDCARNTMSVPDRMTLRVARLKARAKMRRERDERKRDAESRHPRAVGILREYEAWGGENAFVRSVARRFARRGWLSDRQAWAVVRASEKGASRGSGADAADARRRERGRDLYKAGKVRKVGNGVYAVAGSDGSEYLVTLHPAGCPCPDSGKGNRCKHHYASRCAEAAESRTETKGA